MLTGSNRPSHEPLRNHRTARSHQQTTPSTETARFTKAQGGFDSGCEPLLQQRARLCLSQQICSGDIGRLQQLELAAKRLSEAGQTTSKNQQVLEALYFRTLPSRSHQIGLAHAETFKWAYSNDPKHHLKFRERVETREDVLWIHGKPGSGKSSHDVFILQRRDQDYSSWPPGNAKTTRPDQVFLLECRRAAAKVAGRHTAVSAL